MSSSMAARARRGAKALLTEAQRLLTAALDDKGPNTVVAFPSTVYYLPNILAMTGRPVEKLSEMQPVLQQAQEWLRSKPAECRVGPDADPIGSPGMAALVASEAITALGSLLEAEPNVLPQPRKGGQDPSPIRQHQTGSPIDDGQARAWGIRLAEGRMPGFVMLVGCAKSSAVAGKVIQELRRRNLLCFVGGNVNGRGIIEQLQAESIPLGYETGTVPLGMDTVSVVHALGFATRLAMALGGLKPGMWTDIVDYCRGRLHGLVLALGEMDDPACAVAVGAMQAGFAVIADTVIPNVPRSSRAHKHLFSMAFETIEGENDLVRAERLVQMSLEASGLGVKLPKVDVPVPYGPAFIDEVVGDGDLQVEFGADHARAFTLMQMVEPGDVTDGKIQILGPDPFMRPPQGAMNLGLVVRVAGRKMHPGMEPVLEGRIREFVNSARGVQYQGERDAVRIRISGGAAQNGFGLGSLGKIVQARLHEDFGEVVDRVEVAIITDPSSHREWLDEARRTYARRDRHLAELTDGTVEEFYSCTACQSITPNQVCVVSPERPGACGTHNWQDCSAWSRINPEGAQQPIKLKPARDTNKGSWESINQRVRDRSHGTVREVAMYSIIEHPMPAGGHLECIAMLIPEANGVMIVSNQDDCMTPAGMRFSALAEIAGSGRQTPGVMGISKSYLTSPKFISADGGFKRVVWMSSMLKEAMGEALMGVCQREGDPDLLDRIADERNVTTVRELLPWLTAHNHPVRAMGPMF